MSMMIETPPSSHSQLSIKSKGSGVTPRSNCKPFQKRKNATPTKPQSASESNITVTEEPCLLQGHTKSIVNQIIMNECGDNTDMIESSSDLSKQNPPFEALPLLKQRLGYIWEKKMYTDVVFKVGPEEVPIEAHRIILASASELFQKLLFDSIPLVVEEKFVLYEPDVSVPAFEAFIKAFYTNEIPICLTLSTSLQVFYATKKYNVGFLQDQVLNHIRAAVSVPNVFEALRVSTNMIELTFMIPLSWNIIEQQTKEVLEYHLGTLDVHTLARILERDHLNLEEFELYQILVKWGAIMCKQKGMKTTGKNKRHFMDTLLKHIRFTTMSLVEFNEYVSPSRILEPKEIQAILSHQNKSLPKLSIPYKIHARLKPATTPRTFENKTHETGTKLSMAASDSVVITRKNRSAKNSARRQNTSKFRSKRGSIQTPRS